MSQSYQSWLIFHHPFTNTHILFNIHGRSWDRRIADDWMRAPAIDFQIPVRAHPSMKKAAPVQWYLRIVADRLLFVLVAHKGDSNPGRSI